ncbi:MAG: hypothetical protein D6711_03310 [Chloroflexi bacterium]|nr:MAG: hypothetical protein D6711_03310 [Chloroflexota bacterium]
MKEKLSDKIKGFYVLGWEGVKSIVLAPRKAVSLAQRAMIIVPILLPPVLLFATGALDVFVVSALIFWHFALAFGYKAINSPDKTDMFI